MNARATVYDFLMLPCSQRRFISERYTELIPGERDEDRNKRVMQAVAAQGKQKEFVELVAAAKSP